MRLEKGRLDSTVLPLGPTVLPPSGLVTFGHGDLLFRTPQISDADCRTGLRGGRCGGRVRRPRPQGAPEALEQWNTAARYFLYSGFGALLASLATAHLGGRAALAGWVLLAGGTVFAGSVGGLALGSPRWFGAIAPLGGLGLIGGFVLLAWAVLAG